MPLNEDSFLAATAELLHLCRSPQLNLEYSSIYPLFVVVWSLQLQREKMLGDRGRWGRFVTLDSLLLSCLRSPIWGRAVLQECPPEYSGIIWPR